MRARMVYVLSFKRALKTGIGGRYDGGGRYCHRGCFRGSGAIRSRAGRSGQGARRAGPTRDAPVCWRCLRTVMRCLKASPALAKTLAVGTLADAVDCDYLPHTVHAGHASRATSPARKIFNPREGTYSVKKGPVFGNLILADEINRAPAKVQAALLEAMQERQVTLGRAHLSPRCPVHGACDAEPHRTGGHVPVAGGATRPVHDEAGRSAIRTATKRCASSTAWPERATRAEGIARHDRRGHLGCAGGGAARSSSTTRSSAMRLTWSPPPVTRRPPASPS